MSPWTDRAKRVLYHAPSPEPFRRFVRALAKPGAPPSALPPGEVRIAGEGLEANVVFHGSVGSLVDDLRHNYVNLLIIDLTCGASGTYDLEVLRVLDDTDDIEDRYPFHRILAVVAGRQQPAVDRLLLELGGYGIGGVIRRGEADERIWAASLRSEILGMLGRRRPGKRALCAAGGGITGIFFELGALKCIDDCLDGAGVNDFDMYFGISAGAVVCTPLAVGYSVDEFMAAICGDEGSRIPPVDLRLFRIGHLDTAHILKRFQLGAWTAWTNVWGTVRSGSPPTSEEILFKYADLVAPPFRASRFEQMMRGILAAPPATNDFRELERPLFVGVTDQDERRHVLFGDGAFDDVPISVAVQASMSINPAFSATRIRGRYYEDGAVTRTSNFIEAIKRGATLILVIDPFVPYVAKTPGYTDHKGVLYNLDQDIRTVSFTRYETTRNWVLRKYPEVSSYTFVPANRIRRLISNNPMDHRPYLEIFRGAYLSTLHRLIYVRRRLEGDLAAHGISLVLDKAQAVAERLESAMTPVFSDFFPDGKVVIKQPPMPLARQKRVSPPGSGSGAQGAGGAP